MRNVPSTDWNPSQPLAQTSFNAAEACAAKPPPLVQALQDYNSLNRRRFHVPAHSGSSLTAQGMDLLADPYRYDLTELDGLDVLSEPSGCIQEAQDYAVSLFGAERSYFLVNGASVGLMAALLACVQPGDKVLLPRNVHRSVLSGLILTGASPVWFLPERLADWGLWGGVSVEAVRAQLAAQPDIKALFLTSPTYEGIGSDVAAIASLCREYGVLLVVDEAHGSLWPLSDALPASAIVSGADAVIHSIHKSGGCLTQGALAHLPKGSRIDPQVFQQALNTLQTTSPSYLLMASLDATCHFLGSVAGQARIDTLMRETWRLRQSLEVMLEQAALPEKIALKGMPCDGPLPGQKSTPLLMQESLRLFEPDAEQRAFWDPTKLYFIHPRQRGDDWGALVEEELKIAYESASPYGVLYLANLGLQEDDFVAFQQALAKAVHQLAVSDDLSDVQMSDGTACLLPLQSLLESKNPAVLLPEMVMTPRDAFFLPGETVSSEIAVGRIAKETVVHCPPGIPVLLPGERIQQVHVPFLPEQGVLVLR